MIAKRVPIRWLLTVWYTALLLVGLLIFGGLIYFGLRNELSDNLDEQLASQVDLVRSAIRVDGGVPVLAWENSGESGEEQFVRVWNSAGLIQADTASAIHVTGIPDDVVRSALAGQTTHQVVRGGGVTFRTMVVPIIHEKTVVGALQVGLSQEDVTDPLTALRRLMAVTLPIMLVVAGVSGYALAGRALRPVGEITRLAREISGNDLGRRLNLELPDDEMGQLADTFDAMLGRIERAFDRQRRFTGDAAHELRTPIGLMRSRVDVALNQDRTGEQYRTEFARLQADLERMTDLIAGLLMLARTDAEDLPLERQTFQLDETIEHVIALSQERAQERGLSLRGDTVPVLFNADEDLIIQLLSNLIDNAIRNTPPGGTVTVRCRTDSGTVTLEVIDSGKGIPPELHERVFERFFRIEAGRGRDSGGTGLGLSLCKAIVEAHGGTIEVVDTGVPGTTIRVNLANPTP